MVPEEGTEGAWKIGLPPDLPGPTQLRKEHRLTRPTSGPPGGLSAYHSVAGELCKVLSKCDRRPEGHQKVASVSRSDREGEARSLAFIAWEVVRAGPKVSHGD